MCNLDQDSLKALKNQCFQWLRCNTSHNTIYRKSTSLRFMHVCIDPAGVPNRNRNGRNWRRAFPFANPTEIFTLAWESVTDRGSKHREVAVLGLRSTEATDFR